MCVPPTDHIYLVDGEKLRPEESANLGTQINMKYVRKLVFV